MTAWFDEDKKPADPCSKDVFIELDYLIINNEPMFTSEMQDTQLSFIETSFRDHRIQIHIEYSSIAVGSGWDTLGYSSLESLRSSHFSEEHEGTWHYCLVVKYILDKDYQWAWQGASHGVYTVSGQDCIDFGSSEDEVFAQYFQQGIGSNLGLRLHINEYEYSPYNPVDTSMTKQVVMENDYLEDDSNTVFVSNFIEYIFGGCEYSCDFEAEPNEWKRGLFYTSVTRYEDE
jgi:hypothetical protein